MRKGVTLLELLIVVLIVGILAVIAVPKFEGVILKSKFAESYLFIDSIRMAQEAYFMEESNYSDDISWLDLEVPSADERYFVYATDTDTGIDDPPGFEYNAFIIVGHPNPEKPDMVDVVDHPHVHSRGRIGTWKSDSAAHTHGDFSHTHTIGHGNPF